jgi:hypothetical protein
MTKRHTQNELDGKQRDQMIDQVTGWDSDQFNELSQKRHRSSIPFARPAS